MSLKPDTPEGAAQFLAGLNLYTRESMTATICKRFNIAHEKARRIVDGAVGRATKVEQAERRLTEADLRALDSEHGPKD